MLGAPKKKPPGPWSRRLVAVAWWRHRRCGDGPWPPAYMWSIITCPKPEQLTWVAPSIRRAKS